MSIPPGKRMTNALAQFNVTLAGLVDGVSRFNVDKTQGVKIVAAEKELSEAIDELVAHQILGNELIQLKKEIDTLDQDINGILVKLSESRKKLQPISYGSNEEESSKVSTDQLLAYATKIAKFTQAPAGYNPEIPGANLPWPTEDELRKGVVASIATGEIENQNQNQQEQTITEKKENEKKEEDENQQSETVETRSRRRSSLVSYGDRPQIDPNAGGKNVLDLDLFDPDEDDGEDE